MLELTQLQSLSYQTTGRNGTLRTERHDRPRCVNVADSFVTDLTPLLPLTNLELVDVRRNCLPGNVTEDSAYLALVDRESGSITTPSVQRLLTIVRVGPVRPSGSLSPTI